MIDELMMAAIVLAIIAIPLVLILLPHQRKMAQMLRGDREEERLGSELYAIRQEIGELRRSLGEVQIALDSRPAPALGASEFQERLTEKK